MAELSNEPLKLIGCRIIEILPSCSFMMQLLIFLKLEVVSLSLPVSEPQLFLSNASTDKSKIVLLKSYTKLVDLLFKQIWK